MPEVTDKERVHRGFADTPEGEIHYRTAGGDGGTALVMLHASPWSSRTLTGLIGRLGRTRRVFAPDTWGNGDSAKPDREDVEISDYAEVVAHVLDDLGLEQVDLYGTHTGASIALELCIHHSDRVRRVILDGISLRPDEVRRDMLQNYATPMEIDWYGSHLLWAWAFQREQFLFFPHYRKEAANRVERPLPPPEALHELVMDLLKSGTTYHLAYNAAFRYRPEDRLPLLTVPALVCAAGADSLAATLEKAAALAPGDAETAVTPGTGSPEALEETARIYERFLDQ